MRAKLIKSLFVFLENILGKVSSWPSLWHIKFMIFFSFMCFPEHSIVNKTSYQKKQSFLNFWGVTDTFGNQQRSKVSLFRAKNGQTHTDSVFNLKNLQRSEVYLHSPGKLLLYWPMSLDRQNSRHKPVWEGVCGGSWAVPTLMENQPHRQSLCFLKLKP